MRSYIRLTLDTAAPDIYITAPNFATRSSSAEIRVVANEPLDSYQDIYIIDAKGERHDLTLTHADSEFYGTVTFRNIALGMATIYARVRDIVYNPSIPATLNISILHDTIKTSITAAQEASPGIAAITDTVELRSEEART